MPEEIDIEGLVAEASDVRLTDARKTIDRLQRNLAKEKDRTEALTGALKEAIADGIAALHFPPPAKPVKDQRRKAEEYAIAILGDWQLGKATISYSSAVCEERIALLADKIIEVTEIQRADHPVRHLKVFNVGDILEGELIFPGQAHEIDSSLYRQLTVDGPRIMGDFLRRMEGVFETVEGWEADGNHGRLGGRSSRDYHPESNADRMLWSVLEEMFRTHPKVKLHPTEARKNWYAIADLGEKCRFLLFHGDQVRGGFAGFPWYGFGKKLLGWKALAANGLMEDFNYAVAGHWHTPTTMYMNDIRLWVSGSPESHNAYALEQLASMGRPCQWLLFAKPGRGVTSEHLIHLDRD